eukprot:c28589_g1_i2 orf=1016-2794(+)
MKCLDAIPIDQNHSFPASTTGRSNIVSFRLPQASSIYQGGQMQRSLKHESSRFNEACMDIDGGASHCDLPVSLMMLHSGRRCLTENMQVSGGLMRYHSAPSSMLSRLVEVDEDFFPRATSHLNQGSDAEFAQFLADDLSSAVTAATTHCDTSLYCTERSSTGSALHAHEADQCLTDKLDHNRLICQQPRFKRCAGNPIVDDVSRLSAILEHGSEVQSDNLCSSQMSVACTQRVQTGQMAGVNGLLHENGSCNPLIPPPTSLTASELRGNLIRHRSSPAGLLSHLAVEVCGQTESNKRPSAHFSGRLIDSPAECVSESPSKECNSRSTAVGHGFVPAFTVRNCFQTGASTEGSDELGRLGGSPQNNSGLLRQSSSPAGLFSQLSLDGISETGEKLRMPSSSGNSLEEGGFDRNGASAFLSNFPAAGWDDSSVTAPGNVIAVMQNGTTAFSARKRVRELEAKMIPSLSLPDCQQRDILEQGVSISDQFGLPMVTSPESQISLEKASSDSVLCRARAKRGCATHPRSIAERVRRTRISERMKKLQELVPNMDKQTNTADMLDEAVEYVKFLQRQVQELSKNQQKCDGSCRQKANA